MPDPLPCNPALLLASLVCQSDKQTQLLAGIALDLHFQNLWYYHNEAGYQPIPSTVAAVASGVLTDAGLKQPFPRLPTSRGPGYEFRSVTRFPNANEATLLVPANANRVELFLFDSQGSGDLRVSPQEITDSKDGTMILPLRTDSLKFTIERDYLMPTYEWWVFTPVANERPSYWELVRI